MKKLLLIAVCLIATSVTYAQKWYVGPEASFSITAMGCNEVHDRSGLQIGAFGGYEFNKVIGIELQAFYSLQGGANTTWDRWREMENFRFDLHYINIPLLAKINISKGFTGYVGPQVGFLVGAKAARDANKVNIMDYCNKTDFGIMMGLGYQFKFGLRLMADYTLGVTNIFPDDSAQNRVFSIKAGWRF